MLSDPAFRKNVDSLLEASRQAAETPAWFQRNHSGSPLTCAAYFSMEFMLSEALPIYSGESDEMASRGPQVREQEHDWGIFLVLLWSPPREVNMRRAGWP